MVRMFSLTLRKHFANKGFNHWLTVAFTAFYYKLWESSRLKSIFHKSSPMGYYTNSMWKQFIKSASAAEHKSTVFCGHVCSNVQWSHSLMVIRGYYSFIFKSLCFSPLSFHGKLFTFSECSFKYPIYEPQWSLKSTKFGLSSRAAY